MKPTTIVDMMVKDHIKLLRDLKTIEKNLLTDPMAASPAFRHFEWNLEKHFFVEERVIFTAYYYDDSSRYAGFFELKKQHINLLKRMKTIKKQIRLERQVDFTEFRDALWKHKTFEENNIYPVIDKEIDPKEKILIIERINEIL